MRQAFVWAVRLLVGAVIVAFCVSNRESMSLSLFPLPFDTELPKYLFALIVFGAGVIIGMLIASGKLLRAHIDAKRSAQQADALKDELAALKVEVAHKKPVQRA